VKIENHETVKVSERIVGKNIAALPIGTVVDAKVMKRLGGSDVILDINGKELRAHFKNGAPSGRNLSLVLNERKDGLLFFSLRANNALRLAPFLISDQTAVFSNKVLRYLNAAPDSIFEFNRIAAGVNISGNGLAALFNSVAQRHGNPPWLFVLANYLSLIGMGHEFAVLVDPQGQRRRDGQKKPPDDESAARSGIADIVKEAATEEFIMGTMSQFLTQDAFRGFELPFFNGESYTSLKCLSCEGAWVFQVNFSHIGRIEIMAKKMENVLYVDAFIENAEVLNALKKQEISGPPVFLNFHNLKISVTKLLAIYNAIYDTGRFTIEA